jgi:cell division protein FtsW (lipid II flippase)
MRKKRSLKKKPKMIIAHFDSAILISYLLLCFIGLYMNLNISSVTERIMQTFFKQAFWFVLACLTMVISFFYVDMKKIRTVIPLLTFVNIILLILVLFIGKEIKGAQRSFSFFGINFQPSLPMRVMLVLYFAHFLDKKKAFVQQTIILGFLKHYKPIIIVSLISFGVILKQQHFSTIIISSATLLSMLWIARIRISTLIVIVLICLSLGFAVLKMGASYRSSRMEIYAKYSLFHRLADKEVTQIQADDYQIKQSLTSMSQGGFWGTTSVFGQAKNYYLPEPTTDYIYSVVGEEFGLLGALVVFALYIVIFFRGVLGSFAQDDLYLKLAGIGLTLNVFFNAMVNIGVAMSALPSTGVTLPFISYGGTSLVTNSICIGLILNITAKRRLWQKEL